MAATLIHGDNGLTFLQRLMYSEMLEVSYINDDDIETTVRVPAVLACEFSERFDALCGMKHILTAEEVLTTDQIQFESNCVLESLESMLEVFVAWLYTSSLNYINHRPDYGGFLSHADLWFFGQMIVAPKFQDAILLDLCSRSTSEPTSMLEYISVESNPVLFSSSAECVWKQADFSIDHSKGYDLGDNEVYYENKKFLHFFLDTLAYEGIGNKHVCRVIRNGGPLAVQLMKRIEKRARSPLDIQPPWHESNIRKYLITKSEAQVEEKKLEERFGLNKELEEPIISHRLQAQETSRDPLQLASDDFPDQLPSPAPSNSHTVIKNGAKLAKGISAVSHENNFEESRGAKRKRSQMSGVTDMPPALHQTASQINSQSTAFNSPAQPPLPKQPQSNTIIKNEHEGSLIQKYEESARSNYFSEASMNFHAMANAQAQLLRSRSTSSETSRASSAGPAVIELIGGWN